MASHKAAFDAIAGAIDSRMPAEQAAGLIRAYGDAVKRGILGDDLNPSELVLHANGYRWLADEIGKTMADPDRWDGDGAEEALLAEYVRWLAAEVAHLRAMDDFRVRSVDIINTLRREALRAVHLRDAAQLLEDANRDDDAVNLLRNVADGIERQPDTVVLEITREDADGLSMILMSDRYRMDKGDGQPVPQPRWGVNFRVSQAVAAALNTKES